MYVVTDKRTGSETSLVTPLPSTPSSTSGAQDMDQFASSSQDESQELPPLPGPSSTPHHPIAEFLYQLTKMLTDNNDEVVEWDNGKIKVHNPEILEAEVLHKYFRHSKFASFQRQLNYFGFRKIAGKGKMSPCSYVNDAATSDIRSILLIKRKTNGSAARRAAMAQRASLQAPMGMGQYGAVPMSAEFFKQALSAGMMPQALHPGIIISDPRQQAVLQQQQQGAQPQKQGAQGSNLGSTQDQQQKSLAESFFFPSQNTLAMLTGGQRRLSVQDLASFANMHGFAGSFDQLQSLTNVSSALNLAGFGMTPSAASLVSIPSAGTVNLMTSPVPAPISSANEQFSPPISGSSNKGPATSAASARAPEGSMPATAAMNATAAANAAAASSQTNNLFESSTALTALVGSHDGDVKEKSSGPGTFQAGAALGAETSNSAASQQKFSSSNLLRLPSSGAMLPDTLSSLSLNGLLPGVMSSNRLNSVLSMGSFFSREPSMADFAPDAYSANMSSRPNIAAPIANTTLLPLTGPTSAQLFATQFGGASGALASLTNAAAFGGSAAALFNALAAGGLGQIPGQNPVVAATEQTGPSRVTANEQASIPLPTPNSGKAPV